MEKLSILVIILSLYILSLHAYRNARIVGGYDAHMNQFPYQVSLRYQGLHICGGSILTQNYVLTAAHCIGDYQTTGKFLLRNASDHHIRAGSIDRFSGGVLVKCAGFFAHEHYGNFLNDVGLIRLVEPLIFSHHVSPIPLASDNVPLNATVLVAGWGRLKQGGYLPRFLQWTTSKVISDEDCKKQSPHYNDGVMCLMHKPKNGICQGDSGGAAVYNGEVVGIANFVVPYCADKKPDGYAKVYYFRNWIQTIITS